MKKRLLSLVLTLLLILGLCSTAFAAEGTDNFRQVNTYTEGQFTDVNAGQWYAPTVRRAYELGLMKGTSGTSFSPNGTITLAETLALACRLHSTYYNNGAQFVQGSVWYQVYVDYAVTNGIIAAGAYESYTAKATRADFVTILAASMPASALPAINTVEDGTIPDLGSGDGEAVWNAAYLLYRAGVLTGSDEYGTFKPYSSITRSEVAAIVVRMADASQRKSVKLKKTEIVATNMYTTATLSLNVGQTSQLPYYFVPSDAAKQNVTWSSSNTKVASVSETGLVTAVGAGTAEINIRSEKGLWTSCKVTVTTVKAEKIYTQATLNLAPGASAQLPVYFEPSNTTNQTVTWSSSNKKVATVSSTGVVTAVSEGTAVITVQSADGKTTSCAVTVEIPPIVYRGKGDKVITDFTLPRGAYFVEYAHNGKSNFIVELYHGVDGTKWDLLSNDLGNCSGRMVVGDALDGDIQNGMLEVEADGEWTLVIKKVSGTTSTNLKGSGDWVTSGSFVATQKRYVCTYSGTNKSNFIVEIYSLDGDWNLAANDIAPCSGSKIITLDIGTQYFISVRSDGDWTIDLGIGDPLEKVSLSDISNIESSDPTGNSGSTGESDSRKYTFNEALEMNEYAANASQATNDALNYINESFSGAAYLRVMYLNSGISKIRTSMSYLKRILDLIDQNMDLELTDGTSFRAMVQANYDLLGTVSDLKATSENYDSVRTEVLKVLNNAGWENLSIQGLTVQLLEAFAQ